MLFNSYAFLLGFLPVALGLHALVDRLRPEARPALLLGLSLVFYGWWDVRFLPLLAGSILANWLVARLHLRTRAPGLIPLAIAGNLIVLAAFKYVDFFAGLIPGLAAPQLAWVLPLGISFFTFHHIMYLADLRAGRAPAFGLIGYGLYIAFFPQVLAGPLVRWREVMHQFAERPYARPDAAARVARGLMLLAIGLSKKVFFGDPLAATVNPVFQAAATGAAVTVAQAWQAMLGFTFQIYFDFSGYTDMALGIALLFGVVLPLNFDAPYRAASVGDFWRRWHMTLSRFLRDYLYIPLGGNRRGLGRHLLALFATMTLAGLWHGAGLTFVAWGAAHGAALGVGVLWRRAGFRLPVAVGWPLTFAFVAATWILFRASDFQAAGTLLAALLGQGPVGDSFAWRTLLPAAGFALFGPTAWDLVHRLPPARWLAAGFAILTVVLVLKIGDEANYAFIYFQF